jgi:hypothetical protein
VRLYKLQGVFCHKLPDTVGLEDAVLLEPLAIGVRAAKIANLRYGDTVIIFGSGTVELLCAAVKKASGTKEVATVDILESKLQFSRRWIHSKKSDRILEPLLGAMPNPFSSRMRFISVLTWSLGPLKREARSVSVFMLPKSRFFRPAGHVGCKH